MKLWGIMRETELQMVQRMREGQRDIDSQRRIIAEMLVLL